MTPLKLILMKDGSLFDLESFDQSICEILPTVYQIDVGRKQYGLNEDSNEYLKHYSNATEVTIHLFAFQNEIEVEKLNV